MAADLATLAIQVDADKATAGVLAFGSASLKAAAETGVLESTVGVLESTMSRVRTLFGLGLFGFQFLKETIDAQDAMAQLEAGVRSTGTAAGYTALQLAEQAQALQQVTTYSDETISKGQAVLLTFQNIGGQNFQRTIQAAADLATRMGGDVPEAARALGRALEDPANGLLGLRRAGILFTEGQKQMLTDLVNTGQAEKAQTDILDLLQQRLGGSAAAARDTLGGALKGLVHDFGDLFEVTRSGASPVIDAIKGVDESVNFLKEHMDALTFAAGALAAVYAGRLAASAGAYVIAQANALRSTAATSVATLAQAEALTALTVESRLAAEMSQVHAKWLLNEANIHMGNTYDALDEAAAIAELTAAKAGLIAADEALVAAEMAVTDAQIAEAAAAETVIATTTVMGVVMKGVSAIASTMWKAIGGPIGLVIIGITALIYVWNKWRDSIKEADEAQKAAKAGLANDPALEASIQKIKRETDAQNDAITMAHKANAERDAQTAKINALNAVYDRSSLALKVYGLELDSNIEKVKAHKDVVQTEWATIDASIDAMTRAQVAAAKNDFARNSAEQLRDLQANNAAMVQSAKDAGELSDAQEAIGIAQMFSTRAGIDAQVVYDHLNVALEINAKLEAARVELAKASRNATDEEVAAAKTYYDETVRGIEAEQRIRDATIDRTRTLEDLKSAMQGVGDIMDMISGKSKLSIDSLSDSIKELSKTIEALAKSGSLMDAIGVLTGQSPSGGSPNDIFKLPSASQVKLGKIAAGVGEGVGIAGAGFGIGEAAGNNIKNPFLAVGAGTLGGAASGAAMGATLGGPIGAVAGGIIGAASGLVGSFVGLGKSASALAAEERARALAESQVASSLADWRAQITGTAEDQARANEADLRLKYLQMVQTIESTEAGKKMEQQREKDLAEAADLYSQAQKHLTDTTNALNDAFSNMVNAVSGYRLNQLLFNYSPAYGPGGTPSNPNGPAPAGTTPGAATGGGTGHDDGSDASMTINLNVDGKVLSQSVVRYARKVAQANTGDSSNIVDALQLIR